MSAGSRTMVWPSSHDFVEAIQNPHLSFRNQELRGLDPSLDRLGMPLVASGNFAYAFKLRNPSSGPAIGIRCFRGYIPDRDNRYAVISRHLAAHRVPCLTDFRFDQEGILVAGRRYPIIVMEWIEGPTLDLYVEQILHEKAALLHLADEWLRVLHALRSGQVAHGDLQHGNIIVQNGQIRLIDLDGMFVSAMQGWPSIELGHPHFQHPRRSLTQFDIDLDNFSALVIYLTLVALAEAPDLWHEYHDENLIFCRSDFLNPAGSKLFERIRQLGLEPKRLAETLEKSALAKPQETPCLLDLVMRKSGLPSWMTAPPVTIIHTKTREAPPKAHSTIPDQQYVSIHDHGHGRVAVSKRKRSKLPPAGGLSVNALPFNVTWKSVHHRAWTTFPSMLLLAYGMFATIGALITITSPRVALSFFAGMVVMYGGAYALAYLHENPTVVVVRSTPVYHKPGCARTPHGNVVYFDSPSVARLHGYKPCKYCKPGHGWLGI